MIETFRPFAAALLALSTAGVGWSMWRPIVREAISTIGIEYFMANNYHKTSDDLSQPALWDQSLRFVDSNYRVARAR